MLFLALCDLYCSTLLSALRAREVVTSRWRQKESVDKEQGLEVRSIYIVFTMQYSYEALRKRI